MARLVGRAEREEITLRGQAGAAVVHGDPIVRLLSTTREDDAVGPGVRGNQEHGLDRVRQQRPHRKLDEVGVALDRERAMLGDPDDTVGARDGWWLCEP